MLKVLIVDDSPQRHTKIQQVFQEAGYPAEFVSCRDPSFVTDQDLDAADMVFLDHDMCVAAVGTSCPKYQPSKSEEGGGCGCPNGMDLVTRMIGLSRRPRCVVHTLSAVGGKKMLQGLVGAGFPACRVSLSDWGETSNSLVLLVEWGVPLGTGL